MCLVLLLTFFLSPLYIVIKVERLNQAAEDLQNRLRQLGRPMQPIIPDYATELAKTSVILENEIGNKGAFIHAVGELMNANCEYFKLYSRHANVMVE